MFALHDALETLDCVSDLHILACSKHIVPNPCYALSHVTADSHNPGLKRCRLQVKPVSVPMESVTRNVQ